MRRLLPYFLLLFCLICTCACKRDADSPIRKVGFIYLENNTFHLDGKDFFPLMLNYVPSFQSDSAGHFIVAPHEDYDSIGYVEAFGQAAVAEQMDGHLQLIEELGFNTVRICFDRISKDDDGRMFYCADRKFYIDNDEDVNAIFAGLAHWLKLAKKHHLRVMPLLKPAIENADLENFIIKLLHYFQNEETIFAYDFMNEPLYFDEAERRDKIEAMKIVTKWRGLMREYAPYQLFTIGFSEPIEVFEWDPSILPVDFVEFHTYHPLRVPSEIYWYANFVGKPWMIGETGLPADNDSISYLEQAHFFEDAYALVRDAGGAGFGWWEFQELPNTHFEAAYTGLLNHSGMTYTADGKHAIYGTLKPAANCVKILPDYKARAAKIPVNYYNMLGYNNICIKGKVVDSKTGKGIHGAVIRGWNENWSVGMNTFTDENGCFTLYSNDLCVHFEISAPGMSHAKFDYQVALHSSLNEKYDADLLKNRLLEYHHISFQPFLQIPNLNCKSYEIFAFKPELFNQYVWTGEMETVKLSKLPRKCH